VADPIRAEDENASAEDSEESADAAKDAEPAVDAEDDTSSKLHFEMSSEDIDMLEAQLRELSAPTPSPVPSAPAAPEELVDAHGLAKTPLPEEEEPAQIELTPVVDFCSAEKEEMNSVQENDGHAPPPPLASSLESEEVTDGKSEM